MSSAKLTINLESLVQNWRALNALSSTQTGAVVKADGYGLGADIVGRALLREGVQSFFVATALEGKTLRDALGGGPNIYVFSGHMEGDTGAIRNGALTPMLNSTNQLLRHLETLPGHLFGIQLDTGMNRLGMEPNEWFAVRDIAIGQRPALIISHLACADIADHPMNISQLETFQMMTNGLDIPRSLAATGGILLGKAYHFEMTRPGIGLYGGMPFADTLPVVSLDLPIIQVRNVLSGETVGYGNSWFATCDSNIETVSGGYAEGIIRAMGPNTSLYAGDTACPIVGRISMDLITADITNLSETPDSLQLLGKRQTVETVASAAGTIGYEILTSLGQRYYRSIIE